MQTYTITLGQIETVHQEVAKSKDVKFITNLINANLVLAEQEISQDNQFIQNYANSFAKEKPELSTFLYLLHKLNVFSEEALSSLKKKNDRIKEIKKESRKATKLNDNKESKKIIKKTSKKEITKIRAEKVERGIIISEHQDLNLELEIDTLRDENTRLKDENMKLKALIAKLIKPQYNQKSFVTSIENQDKQKRSKSTDLTLNF